jgi:hypothetical protein
MHEDLDRRHDVKPSSDRAFGLVMSVAFAMIAVAPLRHGLPVRVWAAGLSAAFALPALLAPAVLRPLNVGWSRIGMALHRVTSPVAVAIVFYLAVVPTGLLMRASGKDLLRRRRDPAAGSYWIPRVPPGPAPESMKQQF